MIDKNTFLIRAENKYGKNKFDYSLINNWNGIDKIYRIKCNKHNHIFSQRGSPHIAHGGYGCKFCKNESLIITYDQVITRLRKSTISQNYSLELITEDWYNKNYINNNTLVPVICSTHGIFYIRYRHAISDIGCSRCGDSRSATKRKMLDAELYSKLQLVHGGRYDYSKLKYTNMNSKVIIGCAFHGDFIQLLNKHLYRGDGCPFCSSHLKISKKALTWLYYIANTENITLIPEFKIPSTKLSLDGFCIENNTAYEFYGDYFHGNPDCELKEFASDNAYTRTIEREERIKKFGYNLMIIWESDFNKLLKNISTEIIEKATETYHKLIVNGSLPSKISKSE